MLKFTTAQKSMLIFLVGAANVTPLFAEQDCAALLAPDITTMTHDRYVNLAYFNQVDSSEYSNQRSSGGLGVMLPLPDGTPLGVTGSFAQLKDRSRRYSNQMNFNLEIDEYRWFYANRIPPERSAAFVECMNAGSPIILRNSQRTQDVVVLKIKWQPSYPAAPATLSFEESRNIVPHEPIEFAVNQEMQLSFEREDPDEPLIVVVNGGGSSASYRDFPTPPPPARPVQIEMCRCDGGGAASGVNFWAPKSAGYCNVSDWRFAECEIVSEICSALLPVAGYVPSAVRGLTLWGPRGAKVYNAGTQTYGGTAPSYDCEPVVSTRICSGEAKGGLDYHQLWGPEGKRVAELWDDRRFLQCGE